MGHALDFVRFRYQLAVAPEDAAVALWGGGGPPRSLRSAVANVTSVRFFPMGDRVLTWGRNGVVVIWRAATGEALVELRHAGPVFCARVFPDGDRVATCTLDGELRIWDAERGERVAAALATAPVHFW